jgi:hypothetical protein
LILSDRRSILTGCRSVRVARRSTLAPRRSICATHRYLIVAHLTALASPRSVLAVHRYDLIVQRHTPRSTSLTSPRFVVAVGRSVLVANGFGLAVYLTVFEASISVHFNSDLEQFNGLATGSRHWFLSRTISMVKNRTLLYSMYSFNVRTFSQVVCIQKRNYFILKDRNQE